MFTNNGSTLQTDITTFGVNMKLAHLGRQALMGVMAVALVAGMSVKSFADEGLLNKVKERGTLLVGLEGTYPPKDEDKEETPSTKSFKIEKNVSSPASRRFAGGLRIK